MLRKEETYLDGATLLAEMLDVPGYRQHADLMWLVSIASRLLETACSMDLGQDKKRVNEALKIVPVIMRELCRDAGTGKKLHDKDHDALVVEKLTSSFKTLAVKVQFQRTEDQLLVCYFMKALNEFLLTFILDHRSCAEKLHPTVLQVIKHFWKEGGMDPLKKNFVQYMRLVMRAQLTTSVNEIESLIERLKADVAKAARGTDEKRGLLTYDETIAIELFDAPKVGLWANLAEECIIPKGTDDGFIKGDGPFVPLLEAIKGAPSVTPGPPEASADTWSSSSASWRGTAIYQRMANSLQHRSKNCATGITPA